MIYESAPWRTLLLKDAKLLDAWAGKPKVTSRRSFLIEQKVFLAAYAMRKLIEAKKLSSSFESKSLRCEVFPAFDGKKFTRWSNNQFEKLYDLSRPSIQTLNVRDLLDLIIHSLIFQELFSEDQTIEGLAITSDRKRKNLWFVNVKKFTSIMRQVACDSPSSVAAVANPETGEWIEWRGQGDAPKSFQDKMAKTTEKWRATSHLKRMKVPR
jgi:hypothetical protein